MLNGIEGKLEGIEPLHEDYQGMARETGLPVLSTPVTASVTIITCGQRVTVAGSREPEIL
ncbi:MULTISPECIES: hypothetical protein [Streptomyces]|uniref:hypothetical protein n=1 Tax=Streptomyces TaxID=1883 RepID=UPI000CD5A5DD|nr:MULTISPECIES: hypothetical protein [Streptomyces]